MAFEKVLATSCEDQWYRRASQIGALEALEFPVHEDIYEVVWVKPYGEYSTEELLVSFEELGFDAWKEVLNLDDANIMKYWDLSLLEVQIRGLLRCVDVQKNVLLISDDVRFTKTYHDLYNILNSLVNATRDTPNRVGICQLDYGVDPHGAYSKARSYAHNVVPGPSEFFQGVLGQSVSALFVTPYGAEKVLAFLRNPPRLTTLEVMPPLYWYKEDWMYTIVQRGLVRYMMAMNGNSLSVLIDTNPLITANRERAVETRDYSYKLMEDLKIPFER